MKRHATLAGALAVTALLIGCGGGGGDGTPGPGGTPPGGGTPPETGTTPDGDATPTRGGVGRPPPPPDRPVVSFSTSSANGNEGATVTITVDSDRDAPRGGLEVSYMIGTVGDITADELTDTSGRVTIPEGDRMVMIEVAITGDGSGGEPEERVIFTLDDDDAYKVDSSKNTFTLTIPADSDYTPPAIPQVISTSASMSRGEDAGTYGITVTLDRDAPRGGLELAYTVSGDAEAGTDYTIAELTGTSGTVTVLAGQRTATITVTITDDSTADEGDETVIVTFTPDDRYGVTAEAHTLTITDNDSGSKPVVGTPNTQTDGSPTAQAIRTAVNGASVLNSVPADQTGRWGFWLDSDNNLSLWAEPPNDTYGSVTVGDSALTGTATYTGEVAGLAYYGQQGTLTGGAFEADIILTADFRDTEDTAGTLTGTVSGFEGDGANDAWPSSVTLGDEGTVSGTGVSGSWSSELYREGSSGNPDGVTGFVDIDFSVNSQPDGRARGAFHAVGE